MHAKGLKVLTNLLLQSALGFLSDRELLWNEQYMI